MTDPEPVHCLSCAAKQLEILILEEALRLALETIEAEVDKTISPLGDIQVFLRRIRKEYTNPN